MSNPILAWSTGDAFGTVVYKKMLEEEINLMFEGSKIFTVWSQHMIFFSITVQFKASILSWYYYLDSFKNPYKNKWAYAVKAKQVSKFFLKNSPNTFLVPFFGQAREKPSQVTL